MGYDCTLHVVDEQMIRDRFVPRLLGHSEERSPFDERDDADELWRQVRDALAGRGDVGPEEAASLVCLLAVTYCAAELPYHYERGVCLSLWEDQPDGLDARPPKELIGDPEPLFEAVIAERPDLRGHFPAEMTGNYSTGMYVSAENVPKLLKWAEGQVKRYGKPEQRLFRGLLAVLRHAADSGLAYWEGAELPVEAATMKPAGVKPVAELEELEAPDDIYIQFSSEAAPTLVLTHCLPMGQEPRYLAAFGDLSQWPPEFEFTAEHARRAARSRDGRWVTCSITPDQNVPDQRQPFRARVSDTPTGEKTVLLPKGEHARSIDWADFMGERVVAVLLPEKRHGLLKRVLPALPLVEQEGQLVVIKGLPKSRGEYANAGIAHLNDGSDVLLWEGNGYELRDGRFEVTFEIGSWLQYNPPTVPYGPDGFFWLQRDMPEPGHYTQMLRSVRRGEEPVAHLPRFPSVIAISPGPEGAVLVHIGHNKKGYRGLVYFPDDDYYIPLEPEPFDASDCEEDSDDIQFLHWAEGCGRLIAPTHHRLWAVPIETILDSPRIKASTGREIKRPK
jgi:hypothetical protein